VPSRRLQVAAVAFVAAYLVVGGYAAFDAAQDGAPASPASPTSNR
jgi:hypothetical protein